MKAVTMQDLAGSQEELDSLLSDLQQRREEITREINRNQQLPRTQAPLPCWFVFADAEIRYCIVTETWVKAAQGWSRPTPPPFTTNFEERTRR